MSLILASASETTSRATPSRTMKKFANVDATGAIFAADVSFCDVQFQGAVNFTNCRFEGVADFSSTEFLESSDFNLAHFQEGANFRAAAFYRAPLFKTAKFGVASKVGGDVSFRRAYFPEGVDFLAAEVQGMADFSDATFGGKASLTGMSVMGQARFVSTTFEHVDISEAKFGADVIFDKARFAKYTQWVDVRADHLNLVDVEFEERFTANLLCRAVFITRTSWSKGVGLAVRGEYIVVEQAVFGESSSISDAMVTDQMSILNSDLYRRSPKLVSLRGTNLEKLTLSGLDLSICRFASVANLDKLRLEGHFVFSNTPRGLRWTRRIVICEEREWRLEVEQRVARPVGRPWPTRKRRKWGSYRWRWETHVKSLAREGIHKSASTLRPAEIADAYRLLRKAREDVKDEPGATDFYYGEMEMRREVARGLMCGTESIDGKTRISGPSGRRLAAAAEYFVLLMYWFVSGYGVRAWRALSVFAGMIITASIVFTLWGIKGDAFAPGSSFVERLPRGMLTALESATSLMRSPLLAVTPVGEWLTLFLRAAGPIVLALAALAIRSRVKR